MTASGSLQTNAALDSVVKRLEAVATRLEAVAPAGGAAPAGAAAAQGAPAAGGSQAASAAYDALLATELAKLMAAAKAVGGPVHAATELLEKAFQAERTVVLTVASCKQPGAPGLQKLLAPLGAVLAESAFLRRLFVLVVRHVTIND